ASQSRLLDEVSHGVVAAWKNAKAEVDGDPTRLGEGAAVSERDHAARLEELDLVTQALRDGHVLAIAPELPFATACMIMQDDEVADGLVAARHQPIVFCSELGLEGPVREKLDEPSDPALDQMNAGGLERLQETAGETQSHAIALPGLAPASGGELDQLWL